MERMELMVYEAPDGKLLFEPTPEQLTAIIKQSEHTYWQQGGNGEAAIRVGKRPGDDRMLLTVSSIPMEQPRPNISPASRNFGSSSPSPAVSSSPGITTRD